MELACGLEVADKLPWNRIERLNYCLKTDHPYKINQLSKYKYPAHICPSSYRNDGPIFGFFPCSGPHSVVVSYNQVNVMVV